MTSLRIVKSLSNDDVADEKSIWTIPPEEISAMSCEFEENNRLHHAIINNNPELAIAIITADAKGKNFNDKSKINESSGGNTPLLLALKTGNMKIVNALLEHPSIMSSLYMADSHDLVPLHWACMLRQNEIILKLISLLNKNDPEYSVTTPTVRTWWEKPPKPLLGITPFFLYINSVPFSMWPSEFVDTPRLRMMTITTKKEIAVAYTDILFHMSSLCTNLGWADKLDFKSLGTDTLQSTAAFEKNFKLSIDTFIKNRNNIQIDLKIAEELAITKAEKKALTELKEKLAVKPSDSKLTPDGGKAPPPLS